MSGQQLEDIHAEVLKVQRHVTGFVEANLGALAAVQPGYRASAENLLAYVALRQLELRRLQLELSEVGLSSLGRSEGSVLSSLHELVQRIEDSLARGAPEPAGPPPVPSPGGLRRDEAERLLHQHTEALLGPRPRERHVYIMVTARDVEPPSEEECAALLGAGMNVLRINSAHGSPGVWRRTAEVVRRVARRMGRPVRVLVDLEGPKIRTTHVSPGPAVLRYRPRKDSLGHVVGALRIPLLGASASAPPTPEDAPPPLRVPDAWLDGMRVGDTVQTWDSRQRERRFRITEVESHGAFAELDKTCYLTPRTELVWMRGAEELGRAFPSAIPQRPGYVELSVGDRFQLWMDAVEGSPGVRESLDGPESHGPPRLGLDMPGVTLQLKPGHRVLLDDGKVEAVVEEVDARQATARVVRTLKARVKVRAEKGVNFPDSDLRACVVSRKDLEVLPEVLEFADVLGVSFIRTPSDLREAIAAIRAVAGRRMPGIIVKLETARALQSLPGLLLEAMRHTPVGLMIARGDLAVEIGFERLAELQQEIMWFAEAAHLPVVWATQVLDTLARTGIPSRAEITDASMSVQAECVMLNKGAHVVDACRTLDVILRKMEQHQFKKRNLFRPLKISLLMGGPSSP
ncbi:pyruvate kinase [Pyxidicoccus sp. MSG2]|uniref:pyruvate kinase n=1 Tax=Pyxidicoccus sp. MSG2 TaxID=2996790 RepID=UPI00226FF494|nr:pyruvate kinase [Pyxidicoccus sp. MSG2]MCY1015879.1 pyruvate kinase [Pyxidicoccus sp. MSG2]